MTDDLPLFSQEEPISFDRDALHDRLHALAVRNIFIGGSSWKYEGWLGQIYSRSLYQTRGRFSKRLFEDTCLREYASIFPTVCGDFAFYQFPTDTFWAKLFRQTPGASAQAGGSVVREEKLFRWGFKIPEQITVPTWPVHLRYGALAGRENSTFLDAGLLEQSFLRALEPYRHQVGVLIFEFGTMRGTSMDEFVRVLDPFLSRLPSGWRFAVEVRNAEFLRPDYFACLRAHDVTHVYNAWTRMPEIVDQLAIADSQTSDLIVARALLRHGRTYEDAVSQFTPYDRTREVNEPVRRGLREIVDIARVDGRPAFLFVNNRLEGNSPATIVAITDD